MTIERNHGAPLTQLSEIELLSEVASERVALGLDADEHTQKLEVASARGQLVAGACAGCNSKPDESLSNAGRGCEVQDGSSLHWGVWVTLALVWMRRSRRRANR